MRLVTGKFQSRADGEYAMCRSCVRAGYGGEDSWWPATAEFWVTLHGYLQLNKCKACRSEVTARKCGVVPTRAAA